MGEISVLNERFHVGGKYIGDYSWETVDTKVQSLVIFYNDEEMVIRVIKRFDYEIEEPVLDLEDKSARSTMC